MMRPSVSSPTGTVDRIAAVGDLLAAHQSFGRVHGDGADRVLAQMLGDFEHQPVAAVVGLERIEDFRQMAVELHVDDGAHHLADAADAACRRSSLRMHSWPLAIFLPFDPFRALRRPR